MPGGDGDRCLSSHARETHTGVADWFPARLGSA
jgi:hypothetical protein